MGFGCTIKTKDGEITAFNKEDHLDYQLLNLSYNGAPYYTEVLRQQLCFYPAITGTHAQYQFRRLQEMVLENIAHAARKIHDCPNCSCIDETFKLTKDMRIIIATNAKDIVSIEGGY